MNCYNRGPQLWLINFISFFSLAWVELCVFISAWRSEERAKKRNFTERDTWLKSNWKFKSAFFGRKLPIRDIAIRPLWISDSHHMWKLVSSGRLISNSLLTSTWGEQSLTTSVFIHWQHRRNKFPPAHTFVLIVLRLIIQTIGLRISQMSRRRSSLEWRHLLFQRRVTCYLINYVFLHAFP